MKTLYFRGYKFAAKIPLEAIADFYKIETACKWKDHIVLRQQQLGMILGYDTASKSVYIFRYGCICFVNFNEDETYAFSQKIEPLTGSVDFHLFSKYNESHTIRIDGKGLCKLWKSSGKEYFYKDFYSHILCIILAKSIELYKLETDVDLLLDKAEKFLNYLQQGKLNPDRKGSVVTAAKILRLEYHIISNIKVFERDVTGEENLESRDVYDSLSGYYELDERIKVIQGKIDNLRYINKSYSSFSYRQYTSRLYWLEITMLAIFPAFYLIHPSPAIKDFINFLLNIIR